MVILNDKIYISYLNEPKENCLNVEIMVGEFNYDFIKFEPFFQPSECISRDFPIFNSHAAGGKLVKIDENHIGLTIGDFNIFGLSQDTKSIYGKIYSINVNNSNLKLISSGHRNPQGLHKVLDRDILIETEHGPRGGDEINIIKKDKNYGWPIITSGEEYFGGKIGEGSYSPEYESPLWTWIPSIAPSGMAFYDRNMFENFKGHLLIGSLKFKSLYLVKIKDNLPISEEIIFQNKIGRIRDVEVGWDGSIYLLTDEKKGGLFKLYKN